MKSFGRVSRQCTSAICVIALLATSFAYSLGQQNGPKRALTHQDYDSWHSITIIGPLCGLMNLLLCKARPREEKHRPMMAAFYS
jgi:hypothetical protein